MGNRAGWARLLGVLLLAWWAFCGLRYSQFSQAAERYRDEFYSRPLDVSLATASARAGVLAQDTIKAAIGVPLVVLVIVVAVLWISKGFRASPPEA